VVLKQNRGKNGLRGSVFPSSENVLMLLANSKKIAKPAACSLYAPEQGRRYSQGPNEFANSIGTFFVLDNSFYHEQKEQNLDMGLTIIF
jgi:hypothetical protein